MADTEKYVDSKGRYAQDPHDAEHCEINAPEHSSPEFDCGHTVNEGPGVGAAPAEQRTYTVGESRDNGPGVGAAPAEHRTYTVGESRDIDGPGVK